MQNSFAGQYYKFVWLYRRVLQLLATNPSSFNIYSLYLNYFIVLVYYLCTTNCMCKYPHTLTPQSRFTHPVSQSKPLVWFCSTAAVITRRTITSSFYTNTLLNIQIYTSFAQSCVWLYWPTSINNHTNNNHSFHSFIHHTYKYYAYVYNVKSLHVGFYYNYASKCFSPKRSQL